MIDPGKLAALKRHLGTKPKTAKAAPRAKRVQKNLSISPEDAARLKALARRDGLSQAELFIAALDAYESLKGKLR